MEARFEDLGTVGYREAWALQTRLMEENRERKLHGERTSNTVLLLEHPPVYTLGKSGKESNMLMNADQVTAMHAEFIHVDRGGDITFHGPGQLVAYPVLDLDALGWGVKEYVHRLEEVVIRTIAAYGIKGCRVEGATGVWLDVGTPVERKICAIGVKCSRGITMHGFALNVNTDLIWFTRINPCGFTDKGVTSMAKELGRVVDMSEVKRKVVKEFENQGLKE